MPELPEVETIRLYLHKYIIGKTIQKIEILYKNSFIGNTHDVVNQKVIDSLRFGKVLNLKLHNGKFVSFHLKMSGQILYSELRKNAAFPVKIPLAENSQMPGRTTRVVIDFSDGSALFFNDLRKFGWVKVTNTEEGTKAPDVTRSEFTELYLKSIVDKSGKPIKALLMDQEKIAGIGNIYANDALFVAGIQPLRISKTLSPKEIAKLYNAVKNVIKEGLHYGGTSATDIYVTPDGTKGNYQDHFKVYGKEGKPCIRCGTKIVRKKLGGRSSFYCPQCQK